MVFESVAPLYVKQKKKPKNSNKRRLKNNDHKKKLMINEVSFHCES